MVQMDVQFGELNSGTHVGCFFHLKQAWQMYLMQMIYMDFGSVSAAMKVGALDLLCVLPEDEVKPSYKQ
jgi:hypothetical protein